MVQIARRETLDAREHTRTNTSAARQTTTTTFVQRSSTPLTKTTCANCLCGAPKMTTSKSFLKWEQKLRLPIGYQVTKATAADQHSFYTPVRDSDRHGHGQRAAWDQLKVKKFAFSEALFQDPAIMGIKRGCGTLGPTIAPSTVNSHHDGIQFIKNFQLIFRHRQCAFIEASLKDSAQQRRVGGDRLGFYEQHPPQMPWFAVQGH